MTVWSLTDFLLRGRVCLVCGAKEENARDISYVDLCNCSFNVYSKLLTNRSCR